MSSQEVEVVEAERHLPAVRQPAELEVHELVERGRKIQDAMKDAMRDGEHYGVIPGTQKPTLLKPGAEKLCQLFLFDPEYDVEQMWQDEHLTATARCTLWHIPSGNRVASGVGLCSTREKKYAYRNANRKCPACGAEAIIKGKEQYGGGWVCWKKRDGCGAEYQDGDDRIEGQNAGQVQNPDIADTYNTVLKMACKRALIAAVLNGTAASDVFTQDMEDTVASSEPVSSSPSSVDQGRGAGSEGSAATGARADSNADAPPRKKTELLKGIEDNLAALKLADASVDWQLSFENIAEKNFGKRKAAELTVPELQSMYVETGKWLANATPGEAPF